MAGYMHIPDCPGESVEPDHKEWINILSFSQGMHRNIATGKSGSTRQRGHITMGDVVIVKEMDSSTTKLLQLVADGKPISLIKIDFTTSTGAKKRVPFFQYELKHAMITNFEFSGVVDETSTSVPTEHVSFNYEEIKWVYDKMGKDGVSKGKMDATWKVEEGTA